MIRLSGHRRIDHGILACLYLKGLVRRSAIRIPEDAADLDRGISRLRRQGLIVSEKDGVRLTPLGERRAYALACGERRPLQGLLGQLGASLSPGRLLDLGCGPGVYLPEAAARKDLDVVGLDSDPDSIAVAVNSMARTSRRAHLVRGEAERLPFPPDSFDHILCAVVLPYVRQEETLGEAARVLRRGGRMIITAHGAGYYLNLVVGGGMTLTRRLFGAASIVRTLAGRRSSWLPGARFQSPRRVARKLARHGVSVIKVRRRSSYRGFSTGFEMLAEKGRGD